MKEMVLDNITSVSMKNEKQDRLEQVLVADELILNRINARLDEIKNRQMRMEEMIKAIDGLTYLIEWKLEKEGVK
jgi:type II secretory pathway component HofQ